VVALVKAIRAELHRKFPFGCKADISYALASRNLEIDNPRLVTGGFILLCPEHSGRGVLSLDNQQCRNTKRECHPRHQEHRCHVRPPALRDGVRSTVPP